MLVAGASGFTGALAAQIVWDHPRAGAGRRHLAQRRRQAAGRALPALPGADRADRARPRGPARGRRGDRRLPARRRRADRRRPARRRASSSSTSPPTSACATARPTSAGTASTAPPTSSAPASTGSPRSTATSCARRSSSPPPAATRPRACWRWRRWPNRACSPRSSSPRCRAPPATAAQRRPRPLLEHDRERLPLQDRGAPAPARDRAGAGGARQPGAGHLRPAPAAARPGRAGDLLRDARRGDLEGGDPRPLRARATPTSPSSTSSTARRTCARVRDTNECHVYVTVEERGRVMAFSRDRQHLEGRLQPGRAEPQPDAGARRDGGARMSEPAEPERRCASSGRAGSTRPTGVEELDPPSSRPASAPAAPTAG